METKPQDTVRGTWVELRLAPGTLTKMVVLGSARIVGKDEYGRNVYEILQPKPRGG